jgi:hypothetical protein
MVLSAVIAALVEVGLAKSLPRPHYSSLDFWDDNDIYTARIAQVDLSLQNVTFDVIEPISVKAPAKDRIVAASTNTVFLFDKIYSRSFEELARQLKMGDCVLVCKPREADKIAPGERTVPWVIKQIGFVQQISSPTTDPLVQLLRKIAGIRVNPTLPNLLSHALEKDDAVSEYCLNHLLVLANIEITPDDAAKLQSIQDDETRGMEIRVLAPQAVVKLTHNPAIISGEYLSLKAVIAHVTTEDLAYSFKFVGTLVAIPGHREESIKFLSDLAKNPKVTPDGVRAIGSGLESHELFNYDNPDPESESLFATALNLLEAPTPVMRLEGADLVFSQCRSINPVKRQMYLERAIAALKAAGKVERDNTTLDLIKNRLAVLEGDFLVLCPPKKQS